MIDMISNRKKIWLLTVILMTVLANLLYIFSSICDVLNTLLKTHYGFFQHSNVMTVFFDKNELFFMFLLLGFTLSIPYMIKRISINDERE